MSQQIWILEWRYPSDNEVNVTCWDTELAALSEACNEMLLAVSDEFDLSDQDDLDNARQINNLIAVKNYQEAIDYYNDLSSDREIINQQFWYVYPKNVLTGPNTPGLLTLPPSIPLPDEDEDKDDVATEQPFVPTVSGATCRGPCGTHNEYAMADKSDGTFFCRSCKMMTQVFGSP